LFKNCAKRTYNANYVNIAWGRFWLYAVGTALCFFVRQNDKDKNVGFFAPIFMLGIWWLMSMEKTK